MVFPAGGGGVPVELSVQLVELSAVPLVLFVLLGTLPDPLLAGGVPHHQTTFPKPSLQQSESQVMPDPAAAPEPEVEPDVEPEPELLLLLDEDEDDDPELELDDELELDELEPDEALELALELAVVNGDHPNVYD